MESTNNYTETDLGNVSPNPKGTYDNATAYEYLDLVEYQGGSYLCIVNLDKTVKGINPTVGQNSETWQLVALPGTSTEEYVAKHTEVIEKAKQVETSRAAVELCKQEVESAQADVEQMRQDTQQVAQNASDANTEAQQAAQQSEASRSAAQTSEQNAAASRDLANTYKENAETAAQEATESKTAAETAAQNAAKSKEDIDNIKSDIEEAAKGENVSQIQQNMNEISQLKRYISNLEKKESGLTTEQKRYIVALFKSAVFSENMSDIVTALEDSFNTIPATGIKLSPTTLKFSGIGDTQKITATLTPDTATSSILWESDNTEVATVKDGVVTAVNDGIATITATSGSATAKCSVNVNTKELYSISNKVCNADFYEATGLKFGSTTANGFAKSWTLLANFSTTANQVVYGVNTDNGCMDFATNGANNSQLLNCKNGYPVTRSSNNNWCYAITHQANDSNITVLEYKNEELTKGSLSPAYNRLDNAIYNGELYIGGKTAASYVGTLHDFSIVMRTLSDDEILQFLKEGVY